MQPKVIQMLIIKTKHISSYNVEFQKLLALERRLCRHCSVSAITLFTTPTIGKHILNMYFVLFSLFHCNTSAIHPNICMESRALFIWHNKVPYKRQMAYNLTKHLRRPIYFFLRHMQRDLEIKSTHFF